jgi:hypothetical protein
MRLPCRPARAWWKAAGGSLIIPASRWFRWKKIRRTTSV